MTTASPAFVLLATVAGAVVGLVLAGVAWADQDVPAARSFGLLPVAAADWSGPYALLLTSGTPERARLWATLVASV